MVVTRKRSVTSAHPADHTSGPANAIRPEHTSKKSKGKDDAMKVTLISSRKKSVNKTLSKRFSSRAGKNVAHKLFVDEEITKPIQIYEEEKAYVRTRIEHLLKNGEASSLVVLGEAGVGKSTLVDSCLASFPVLVRDANTPKDLQYDHLNVIRFNFDGNIHGKNDLYTLRMIGQRLNDLVGRNHQMVDLDDLEVDGGEVSELELSSRVATSVPKVISLFRYLTEQNRDFRAVIVLDNFEVFCRRQQTLLYNLFDLIQHGRSVLVIGITQRLDYLELLEKRVRSRLTQRVVHLIAPFANLDEYQKFCLQEVERLCQANSSLRLSFENNMDSLKSSISKTFSLNRSFDQIKELLLEYSFMPPSSSVSGGGANSVTSTVLLHQDGKIVSMSYLTKNELILLMVATRMVRDQQLVTLTCKQLHECALRVAQLRQITYRLVERAVENLIQLDLLIQEHEGKRRVAQRFHRITPFTKLILNVSEFQLTDLLRKIGDKLPTYFKQIYNYD